MKLTILVLSCLILIVRSETKSEDQKNEHSSLRGKLAGPSSDYINPTYSAEESKYSYNDGILRKLAGLSHDDDHSNEWGYSNNDDRSRDLDGRSYDYGREDSRNEGELNNRAYERENEEYTRNGDDDYAGEYLNDGRSRNSGERNSERDYLEIIEPDNYGYVALKDLKGHLAKYYYILIGRRRLGFDSRTATSYGMRAPITPSLLQVVGRNHPTKGLYRNGYVTDYGHSH